MRASRLGYELTVIAAVVVGGVAIRGGAGTVLGVALGASLLLVIQNGLTLVRVDPLWLQGVYGLVILVAVGIDALVARRIAHCRPRRRDDAPTSSTRLASWETFLALLTLGGASPTPCFRARTSPRAFNISQAIAGVSEQALIACRWCC